MDQGLHSTILHNYSLCTLHAMRCVTNSAKVHVYTKCLAITIYRFSMTLEILVNQTVTNYIQLSGELETVTKLN